MYFQNRPAAPAVGSAQRFGPQQRPVGRLGQIQTAADLLRAYRQRDRKGLQSARRRIARVSASILAMEDAFRGMWMSHNKPEGIETIQARFGMLQARYRELDRRLSEYLRGDISRIAELEYRCPPTR